MMKCKVISTIRKFNMIEAGDKVLVALSGGSDSMSLLYSLYEIKDEFPFVIEAAHVNHSLRGEESDNDEKFVREVCEKLGIKLHVLRADVAHFADENGLSLEDAGRKIRYDYFSSLCPDGKIATAHNLNDRIETFLFNFTRGSGLKGLCSIPPVRGNVIRPLIECSKDDIISYCEEKCLLFVTDKTNYNVEYSRNRIRHNVIPQLKQINNGFENTALRCIDSLNEDEVFLRDCSLKLIDDSKIKGGYSIEALVSSPLPVLKRALMKIIFDETNADIDAECVTAVLNSLNEYSCNGRGMVIQLPLGRFARTRYGMLEFPSEVRKNINPIELSMGKNYFGDFEIDVESTTCDGKQKYLQKVSEDVSIFYIDCDKISGNLIARSRESGDSVTISYRKVTKPLRKLMNEKGISPEIRDSLPVIADDKKLVCAFGCGTESDYEVDKNTSNLLKIEIKRGISYV